MTSVAGVLAIAVILAAAGGCSSNSTSKTSATTAAPAGASRSTAVGPTREVRGEATTLGTGDFMGGKDVKPGLYDVTSATAEIGNFSVDGARRYIESFGDNDSVTKIRAKIANGDKIEILRLSKVVFTPVTTPLVTTHTPVVLYAGTWTVGEDIGAGKYVATPGPGQRGALSVSDGQQVTKTLGGSDGVPSVTLDLAKGDDIEVARLTQVTMTPA